MTIKSKILPLITVGIALAIIVAYIFPLTDDTFPNGPSGTIKDEAAHVGRDAASLPGSDSDYLKDMDGGLTAAQVHERMIGLGASTDLTKEDTWSIYNRGRNNWAVWTGGNDRFWDKMTSISFGALDLLKTISSNPGFGYTDKDGNRVVISRDNRWSWFGVINEECYSKPTGPDADRYGLWLDVRDPTCAPDPFADAEKYPGVKIGARGDTVPVGSYYGEPSGVFGLRLFSNPYFDKAAKDHWDADKFYNDPDYYNDKDLVRPYRVGMTCGFCHVGPDPSNPPANFEQPKFANLNNNPGAQYFWIDRLFLWEQDKSNFTWQLFHTSLPGTLDTSFISTDSINNPRTMNAVYDIGGRLASAARFGKEKLETGGSGDNKQFNDYAHTEFLSQFYEKPNTVHAAHVLKDGADSVGILGALNRVYLNIGLFSEDWLQHFRPLVGGKEVSPIEISVARKNSAMWNSNETQTQDLALFFAVSATPNDLASAPSASDYLTEDEATLTHGKEVFATTCARCHSSKIPKAPADVDDNDWNEYWAWSKTDSFKHTMTEMVLDESFLQGNYLSTGKRIPVTLLGTNACSPLATNGIRDNIWDNFSSETYKNLPSVGPYSMQNVTTGDWFDFDMPAGGRGYTRVPSLTSLWSTAPYGLANTVGKFRYEGTVEARMDSFNDSIRKWLWPETRKTDVQMVAELGLPASRAQPKLDGYVFRTTEKSWLKVKIGFLPDLLQKPPLIGLLSDLIEGDTLSIGPIPAGAPINLLANLQVLSEDRSLKARVKHAKNLVKVLVKIVKALKSIPQDASNEAAMAAFAPVVPDLISLSNCPDFVVNRGHYFGTNKLPASEGEPGLTDTDKEALIGYLKTL